MKYFRKCPLCNKDITHTNETSMKLSHSLSRPCRSCSSKRRVEKFGISESFKFYTTSECCGDKNPFFGKKHSEETKNKLRARDVSHLKTDEFRKKMSAVTSGSKNPMHGRTVYQVWVDKYGKEEADIRMCNYKEKQRINSTGENNPMYGKPTPKGSGNGWSGWYKSWYFRSLRELAYVIEVIEPNNLVWKSAESIRIPYIDWDGSSRTYSPDFIINNNRLIEIKPSRLMVSKSVTLKKEAAEKFCQDIGWSYELVDQPRLSNDKIKLLHDAGEIKFIDRYELKFQKLNTM